LVNTDGKFFNDGVGNSAVKGAVSDVATALKSSSATMSYEATTIVTAPTLTGTVATDNPTTAIMLNGLKQVEIGKFKLAAVGAEAIKVTEINIQNVGTGAVDGDSVNYKIYKDGVAIGNSGASDETSSVATNLEDFVIQPGQTVTLTVKADITGEAQKIKLAIPAVTAETVGGVAVTPTINGAPAINDGTAFTEFTPVAPEAATLTLSATTPEGGISYTTGSQMVKLAEFDLANAHASNYTALGQIKFKNVLNASDTSVYKLVNETTGQQLGSITAAVGGVATFADLQELVGPKSSIKLGLYGQLTTATGQGIKQFQVDATEAKATKPAVTYNAADVTAKVVIGE